jgi:uncharacterized membrane protein
MNQRREQEQGDYATGTPSTAAIGGHPLHPALVPFPIGFLVGVVLSDFGFWRTADPFWARASLWLVAAGVLTGLLAAVFGFIDFVTIRRVRSNPVAWLHFLGNLTAVALSAISWFLRARDAVGAVLPTGFALSLVVAAILLGTGWLGGELVFRHKVGVIPGTRVEQEMAAFPMERK